MYDGQTDEERAVATLWSKAEPSGTRRAGWRLKAAKLGVATALLSSPLPCPSAALPQANIWRMRVLLARPRVKTEVKSRVKTRFRSVFTLTSVKVAKNAVTFMYLVRCKSEYIRF
jgi:hypothetical protein